jgi:sedoheptulokinase
VRPCAFGCLPLFAQILAAADGVTRAYVTHHDNGVPFAEQDVAAILSTLQYCLQRLPAALLSRVVRVSVAGQMHGVVLWRSDKPLTHVSRLITWEDQRVTPAFLQKLSSLPTSQRARSLIRQLKAGFGCATLASLAASSAALVDKFTSAGTVMDYVVSLLTGKPPVMEPTVAHSWGLFDVDSRCWNVEAARACGVPTRLLPSIVSEATVVGTITVEASKLLGVAFSEECEVFVAHGDHPCTVLTALRHGAAAGTLT